MRIHVICHDDSSEDQARQLIHQWRKHEDQVADPVRFCIIRNRIKSPFFENIVYEILDQTREKWATQDYIGIITYSANVKWIYRNATQREWCAIREKMRTEGADVMALYPLDFLQRQQKISSLQAAITFHGLHYYRAWSAILSKLGYDKSQIECPDVAAFCCNWWIGTPESFSRYIAFYKKVKQIIETDPEVQKYIVHNSYYVGRRTMKPAQIAELFHGRDYFMLHPFILERLPSFFFHFQPDLCVRHLGPRIPFIINPYE